MALTLSTQQLLDRLSTAASLDGPDAALRIFATYEPAAGPNAKVFPPSYPTSQGNSSVYLTEPRHLDGGQPVEVVILDAHQSQANRCEQALLDAMRSGTIELPQLLLRFAIVDAGRTIERTLSSLEAPHRSRDAYFHDSQIGDVSFDDTPVGLALRNGDSTDARAFLEHAAPDLVFGTWDSHRGRRRPARFPRIYASEMIGVDPRAGRRGGARMDPNVLPGRDAVDLKAWGLPGKAKARSKLSEIGHGMIPPQVNETSVGDQMGAGGGVSVSSVRRLATVSFAGLAALRFGDATPLYTRAARGLLGALALLADRLTFASPAITLRSGSDLVLVSEEVQFVQRGGVTESFQCSPSDALSVFHAAVGEARQAGVTWDGRAVEVSPKPALQAALTTALTTVDLTESAD